MLPVAMARSFPDDVAMHQVLPVLWMTSRYHSMGPVRQNQAQHNRRRLFLGQMSFLLLNTQSQDTYD